MRSGGEKGYATTARSENQWLVIGSDQKQSQTSVRLIKNRAKNFLSVSKLKSPKKSSRIATLSGEIRKATSSDSNMLNHPPLMVNNNASNRHKIINYADLT
jgi:hypothetical protein